MSTKTTTAFFHRAFSIYAGISLLLSGVLSGHAVAEDITSAEYHFNAVQDGEILPGVFTEIWAKLYRPADLGSTPRPLIVMLHGNHWTCGIGSNPIVPTSCLYTTTGACGAGETPISSYLGYDYLGNALAAQGYIVISINANRGITCGTPVTGDYGLNLARGRLVLKHLALLSQWNRYGNAPASLGVDLRGRINFNEVGMIGHSRGGEGVRAAYNLYNDSGSVWQKEIRDPVTFKGIFEIGPVDGQTSRVLNAVGTAWNVLLPMCDGDVSDLEGMKPFDRMQNASTESPALPKSMYAVWGANHNFYNSIWQNNDSPGCTGTTPLWGGADDHSLSQQQTALQSVVPFFLANVGGNHDAVQIAGENEFDPLSLPNVSTESPRIDHAFTLSPNSKVNVIVDHFADATVGQATFFPTTVPEHDSSLTAAQVKWTQASADTYFENDWQPSGQGSDISKAATLDFRVSRTTNAINIAPSTDFIIQLVYQDGTLSNGVSLSTHASLVAPIGAGLFPATATNLTPYSLFHSILQTVRVPLNELTQGSVALVRGIRFTFSQTTQGEIYLTNLGFSRFDTSSESELFSLPTTPPPPGKIFARVAPGINHVTLPDTGPVKWSTKNSTMSSSSVIEIQVRSDQPYPVQDSLPVLELDGKEVAAGGFENAADLHTMTFKVQRNDLQFLPVSFQMLIRHRGNLNSVVKDLGMVQKTTLTN